MRPLSASSNKQTTSNISPKRKRGPSVSDPTTQASTEVQPFAPRLDTSAFPPSIAQQATTEQSLVGSESPRTRVAHQLESLQLRGSLPAPSFTAGEVLESPSAATAPKKAKHAYDDTSLNGFEGYLRQTFPPGWEARSGAQRSASTGTIDYLEVAETPQATSTSSIYGNDSDRISPPPPSSSPSVKLFLSARSPNNAAKSPRSPSPLPATAFTWQDSEITGHLVNPSTDPEDDGEGINGSDYKSLHGWAFRHLVKAMLAFEFWIWHNRSAIRSGFYDTHGQQPEKLNRTVVILEYYFGVTVGVANSTVTRHETQYGYPVLGTD
ncbi:hypothetical protein K490DRAFT_66799 [Saccharata proteae CBS 121410]|uniref:Uncharacterized protein n=1 Tax=Saccharata proteae CBS 121410 TaxID=1314787 RepID=A0A9P4LXN0_9PEZI|nr:hypothetical protein K490DRAFT_66799 [Saccharata proteae CBS 121410]